MSDLYDLDAGLVHCEGCGTITGNAHGLCSRCVEDIDSDLDWNRSSGHTDPNGIRA